MIHKYSNAFFTVWNLKTVKSYENRCYNNQVSELTSLYFDSQWCCCSHSAGTTVALDFLRA